MKNTCLEMDEVILAVQNIFTNFNDHIKPFRNIQIVRENERYLKELKQRLIFFLKKENLWRETLSKEPHHELILRKITLFIIYNTDTTVNGILESGENTSHLLNGPKIPKCVLFYCLQELHLYPFFCDFVQFAPTTIVSAYLDSELISSIELLETQMRREVGLNLVDSLYHHCLWASCTSHFDTSTEVGLENIQDFLSVLFLETLQVERNKLPSCKTIVDYDMYLGHLLKDFLPVVNRCLRKSLSGSEATIPNIFALYQLDDKRQIEKKCSEHQRSLDILKTVNNRLLNRLQVIIIAVTVRTFFNWIEEDITKIVTLQRAVGELANELYSLLTENEILDHEVKNGLKTICVKPLNVEELAENSNIRELIENIEEQGNKDRKIWMMEFLSRGELVLGNEECLKVLLENRNLISVNNLNMLTNFLRERVGYDDILASELFEIVLEVLVHSNNPDEVENFIDSEQPFRIIADYDVDTEDYFKDLTEFFNKLVDVPESSMLSTIGPFIKCLAIEPERTLQQLQNVCISEPKNIQSALKMVELFKGFATSYLDDLVQSLVESLASRNAHKGLECYVITLFIRGLLETDRFVKDVLFAELLKRSREREQSPETLIIINILQGVFESKIYRPNSNIRAPLIIGLGQVADEYRWDLASYTNVLERIVTMCTNLMEIIGRSIDKPFEGKHKSFVIQKSRTLKELNRYWIDKILQEDGELDFVRYLHPSPFQTEKNKQEFLCKTFIRATAMEKELLARTKELQPLFLDMMLTITKAVAGNAKVCNGFEATFVGFIKVFKDILLETEERADRFLEIVANLPVKTYTDHTFVVNNICVQIIESAKSELDSMTFKSIIQEFPESSAKLHLLEQLSKLDQ